MASCGLAGSGYFESVVVAERTSLLEAVAIFSSCSSVAVVLSDGQGAAEEVDESLLW